MVENFGRSFELGLAIWYQLTNHPLIMPSIMPMGMGMLRKGRMDITPTRIKDLTGLKSILAKAKELEGAL